MVWFAMREEYIAGLDNFLNRIPTGLSSRFRLDLLTTSGALRAIQAPAREQSVTFYQDAAEHLVFDLASIKEENRDLKSLGDPPLIEPLHLQVVCRQIWDKRDRRANTISRNDIESYGGVDQALANYYSDQIREISKPGPPESRADREPDQRLESKIRNWFNYHLIDVQDSRYSRALVDAEDKSVRELKSYFEDRDIVRNLGEAYLIRKETRPRRAWYELAHDRLIEPVRRNNKEWYEKHLAPVQKRAQDWKKAQRPDGLLFKGKDLKEARKWIRKQPKKEAQLEREFVNVSRRRQFYTQALRFSVVAILLLFGNVLVQCSKLDQTIKTVETQNRTLEGKNRALKDKTREIQISDRLNRVLALTTFAQRQRWIHNEPELAALLARQSYLFQERLDSPSRTRSHVDSALRSALSAQPFSHSISLMTSGDSKRPEILGISQPRVMVFHPSAEKLAALDGNGGISVYRYGPKGTNRQPLSLSGNRPVSSLAFQPNTDRLVAVASDELILFDLNTGRAEKQIVSDMLSPPARFSPNGRYMITGGGSGRFKLWDTRNWKHRVLEFPVARNRQGTGDEGLITTFSPDARLVAVGNKKGRVSIWRVADPGRPLWTKPSVFDRCTNCSLVALGFGPKGSWLITIPSDDNDIRVWSLDAGQNHWTRLGKDPQSKARDDWQTKQGRRVKRNPRDVRTTSATLFPSAMRVATGDENGYIGIWDLSKVWSKLDKGPGETIATPHENFENPMGPIRDLAVLSKSERTEKAYLLAATDSLGRLRVFETKGRHRKRHPVGKMGSGYMRAVRFDKQGNLYSAHIKSGLEMLDAKSLRDRRRGRQITKTEGIRALDFSPDGKLLVLGISSNEVLLLDTTVEASGVSTLGTHDDGLWAVAYSPSGGLVATGSWDGAVKLWRIDRERAKPVVSALNDRDLGYESHVLSLAIDTFGQWLAVGTSDGFIDIRLLEDGRRLAGIPAHVGSVNALAFSPQGDRLASASDDGTIQLWATSDWTSMARLEGHSGGIKSIDFTRDGQQLASGGSDGEIRLWQMNGQGFGFEPTVLRIYRPHGEILTVDFDPTGNKLAFGDTEGQWGIRSIDAAALAEQVCSRVWRNLSKEEWERYIPGIDFECTCPELGPGTGIKLCP